MTSRYSGVAHVYHTPDEAVRPGSGETGVMCSGEGMATSEAVAQSRAHRSGHNRLLDAADVGQQRIRLELRALGADELNGGTRWEGQDYQV
jgi:hypothetical protein